MTIKQGLSAGIIGNEASKKITGTDEVSAGRTAVAIGAGSLTGAAMAGAVTTTAVALGVASAPVTIPLVVLGGVVAGIASRF